MAVFDQFYPAAERKLNVLFLAGHAPGALGGKQRCVLFLQGHAPKKAHFVVADTSCSMINEPHPHIQLPGSTWLIIPLSIVL
eukprot:scaffold162_cov143-Skeletonema_menzelii.AAC.21